MKQFLTSIYTYIALFDITVGRQYSTEWIQQSLLTKSGKDLHNLMETIVLLSTALLMVINSNERTIGEEYSSQSNRHPMELMGLCVSSLQIKLLYKEYCYML